MADLEPRSGLVWVLKKVYVWYTSAIFCSNFTWRNLICGLKLKLHPRSGATLVSGSESADFRRPSIQVSTSPSSTKLSKDGGANLSLTGRWKRAMERWTAGLPIHHCDLSINKLHVLCSTCSTCSTFHGGCEASVHSLSIHINIVNICQYLIVFSHLDCVAWPRRNNVPICPSCSLTMSSKPALASRRPGLRHVKTVKILRTAMRCTWLPEMYCLILQPPKWSGKECNRSLTVVSCWQRNL